MDELEFINLVFGRPPDTEPRVWTRDELLIYISSMVGDPNQPTSLDEIREHPAFDTFQFLAANAGFEPADLVAARNENIRVFNEDSVQELAADTFTAIALTVAGLSGGAGFQGAKDLIGALVGSSGGQLTSFLDDSGGFLEDLFSETELALAFVAENVGSELGDLVNNSDRTLTNVTNAIGGAIEGLLGDSSGALVSASSNVINEIGRTGGGVLDTVGDIAGGLLRSIGISTDSATEALKDVGTLILRNLNDDVGEAISQVRRIADVVASETGGLISGIAGVVDETFEAIDTDVSENIRAATRALEESQRQVREVSEAQADANERLAETLRDGIGESIEALTGTSESALRQVAESTDEQTLATVEAAAGIEGAVSDTGDKVATPLSAIQGLWQNVASIGDHFSTDDVLERFKRTMIESGIPESNAEETVSILREQFEGSPGIGVQLIMWTIPALYLISLVQQLGQVVVQPTLQRIARSVPSALPGPSDINELLRRDIVDSDIAVELLRLQGFSEALADGLTVASRTLPEIGIVQTWMLREFISRDDAQARLRNLGYQNPDADKLLEMAFFIPPVQDIITWAVREVFNVEQAERFGQFDEFPPEFADLASKQGVAEQFARNYWASHWRLPSLQTLFEMFHRRIIDRDTLELTIKSHDFTPFWRDPLVKVAYRPLTRVDVRRMHDLGLIDEDELQLRYQDLGFSPDDAAMMRDFTVAYNADTETTEPEELERLTRSAILGLFADGAIGEAVAIELMQEVGIGRSAALIFLEAEKMQQERRDRREQIDLVQDQAKAGLISFTEAFDKLSGLGLEGLELERAVTQLERQRAQATRLPSKADLDKFLAAEIITESEYLSTLNALGYSDQWAEKYLQLERRG